MSLATALLWLTEEAGEAVEEGSTEKAMTVLFAVVAVAIAAYLLFVFVTTPAPSGHHDEHDDHGHGGDDAHGHGDAHGVAPAH